MRVCFWGTFDAGHVRSRVLMSGLEQAGARVEVCHHPLWRERDERVAQTAKGGLSVALLARAIVAYGKLCVRLLTMPRPDVVVVGYPGQIDALVAYPICRLRRVPLVLDAFLSLYETAVDDRGLLPRRSWRARLLWRMERLACRAADLVLLDTEADCAFFRALYGGGHYVRVWVGALEPDGPLTPRAATRDDTYDVLFVGTFIPLHGIEYILGAAALLGESAPEVRFTFIGHGQTYDDMRALGKDLALDNVVWGAHWLEGTELVERSARADLVLGVFGASAKAQRVIPAKAYAALAQGRPLLTADTPGSREALAHNETAFLCPPANSAALAEAILAVRANPDLAERVAANGLALYRERFAPRPIGQLLLESLRTLVNRAGDAP